MQWRHPLPQPPSPLLQPPTEDLQLIKRRTLCIRKIDNRQQAQWKCWKAEKRKSRWPRWRAQLKFTTAARLRNYALIKLFYNYSHTHPLNMFEYLNICRFNGRVQASWQQSIKRAIAVPLALPLSLSVSRPFCCLHSTCALCTRPTLICLTN